MRKHFYNFCLCHELAVRNVMYWTTEVHMSVMWRDLAVRSSDSKIGFSVKIIQANKIGK